MTSSTTSSLVSEMLHEYGEVTRAALREYLPQREPRRYLYDLLNDYPQRGGKMMRPSLCIATARPLGAPNGHANPTPVAFERLHNALLVHHDIQEATRQGREHSPPPPTHHR